MKRFTGYHNGMSLMQESSDGEYVLYKDHEAEIVTLMRMLDEANEIMNEFSEQQGDDGVRIKKLEKALGLFAGDYPWIRELLKGDS